MIIEIATLKDIPSIEKLLNSAYRGEGSKKGWTTEADLIKGEVRTDSEELKQILSQKDSVFLKCIKNDELIGCVNLQKENQSIYLGMLSVNPDLQGSGTGKKLLLAAEEFAKQNKCNRIFMTVISVRTELIDWYKRNGYESTGETKPFPNDFKSGIPNQKLEFLVFEKNILAN